MAASIVVGTNSWVTIAESNSYLEGKFGGDAWASLSDTIKTQCLISAFRWISGDPDYVISSVTDSLKAAQIELAWYIYSYYAEHEKREALYAQGVRDFSVSKWKEKLEKAGLPQLVKDLLDEYLTNLGGYFPTITRDIEDNQ